MTLLRLTTEVVFQQYKKADTRVVVAMNRRIALFPHFNITLPDAGVGPYRPAKSPYVESEASPTAFEEVKVT